MARGIDILFSNLESPAEPYTAVPDVCAVSGWACSAGGIEAVEILVDGQPVAQLIPDIRRDDVAAVHPEIEGCGRSGFNVPLDARPWHSGVHELLVRVRDTAGRCQEHRRLVERVESILSHIDVPAEAHVAASETCLIRGWALSPNGVDRIDILVDGRAIHRVAPDGDRPDVAAAYPAVPGAATSGFDVTVQLGPLAAGTHQLQIVIRDTAGNEHRYHRALEIYSNPYHRVLLERQLNARDRELMHDRILAAGRAPHFELWIDARGGGDLSATLRSIAAQTYERWSAYIVESAAGTARAAIAPAILEALGSHASFVTAFHAGDVSGDYAAFLLPGEKLLPDALLHFAARLADAPAHVAYSDHDREEPTGMHTDPDFAPEWSPEHLYGRNYVGGVFFVARDQLRRHGGEPQGAAWRYDLLLRVTESGGPVAHVPRALWSSPTASDGHAANMEAERLAVVDALRRRRVDADVIVKPDAPVRRIQRRLPSTPRVSIVVPTTGRLEVVRTLVESLASATSYPSYDLLFLDNGRGRHPEGIGYLRQKGLRVITIDEPFNWARLNNVGAGACDGELLLFLNDDIEMVNPDWLHELVALALIPDVGTVGALLTYPDGRIQHAGVFLVDHGGGARHYLQFVNPAGGTYQHLADVTREVTASTGACLMARRGVFEEIGGFDETFRVAFNDLDLCMRLSARGYRNVWTPHCKLVHHESISRRGSDIADDERRAWEKWRTRLLAGDPYHNANLAKDRSDCSIDSSMLNRRPAAAPPNGDPQGVNLIGYVRAEMGLGEAARGVARAMERVGIPHVIVDYEVGNPARKGDASCDQRIVERPVHGINLLHVNADLTADARRRLGAATFEDRYTIGYWVWELPEWPDVWLGSFACVNEVWVPSEFVRRAVAQKSPVPVICMPYALSKGPGPYYERPFFELPQGRFLFLTMYDTHSVIERKNPAGAIAAFRDAFAPTDDSVGLVLKINNLNPAEVERLRAMIGGHTNIFLIERTLTRHEVDSLVAVCDCLVSLHRSEGFGLPIAEAMGLGRPVVATNWSGNVDFMDESCAACVDFEIRRLDRAYGPYDAGQEWAEPNVETAARWMRQLAADPAAAVRLGRAGQRRVQQQLSDRGVGERIRARLAEIHLIRT